MGIDPFGTFPPLRENRLDRCDRRTREERNREERVMLARRAFYAVGLAAVALTALWIIQSARLGRI